MAFYGTGAPVVQVMDRNGSVLRTFQLPHPAARERDFRLEADSKTAADRTLRVRRWGWRYWTKMTWVNPTNDQTEDLIWIANCGLRLRLVPHADVPAISYIVQVVDAVFGYANDLIKHDQIELEFLGETLLGQIPNPDLMFTNKLFRRGIIS